MYSTVIKLPMKILSSEFYTMALTRVMQLFSKSITSTQCLGFVLVNKKNKEKAPPKIFTKPKMLGS